MEFDMERFEELVSCKAQLIAVKNAHNTLSLNDFALFCNVLFGENMAPDNSSDTPQVMVSREQFANMILMEDQMQRIKQTYKKEQSWSFKDEVGKILDLSNSNGSVDGEKDNAE